MRIIPIIQFGTGNVGRWLVQHVLALRDYHAGALGLRLEYMAVCDRDGAVVNPNGIPDEQLEATRLAKTRGLRLRELDWGYVQDDLAAIVDVAGADDAIVVDVTASEATVPALLDARRRGYSLVLANKLPLAGPFDTFQQLTAGRRTRFETTVGAALPVISTLQTLLDTGDRVDRIQGCLSGTLGFICSKLESGQPFSTAIRGAKQRGYSEPDPREDLAGNDAARKALILARLLGHRLELADVEVEGLYPAALNDLSVDEFLVQMEALDEQFTRRAVEARTAGRALRYVAEVNGGDHGGSAARDRGGRVRVSLQAVPADSPLARIRSSDSIVVFYTARYAENPLTISGRGAGPEVTAAGVLGDILDIA
jgi:homoserine dehydrogenase